jgi:hypothetical protein
MDRIERSNRFARKRLARAIDNLWRDPQDVPVGSRRREVRSPIGSFRFRHLVKCSGAQEYAVALDEREV